MQDSKDSSGRPDPIKAAAIANAMNGEVTVTVTEQKKEEEDDFLSQDFFFLFMPFSTVLIEI